jgi:hypothetical protein
MFHGKVRSQRENLKPPRQALDLNCSQDDVLKIKGEKEAAPDKEL